MEDLIHGLGRLGGMGCYQKMMIGPWRRQRLFGLQGNKNGGLDIYKRLDQFFPIRDFNEMLSFDI